MLQAGACAGMGGGGDQGLRSMGCVRPCLHADVCHGLSLKVYRAVGRPLCCMAKGNSQHCASVCCSCTRRHATVPASVCVCAHVDCTQCSAHPAG